jgi:hypothetical protein
MEGVNKKFIFSSVFLLALIVVTSANKVEVMLGVRWLLESGWFKGILLSYICVTIISHSITVKESDLLDIPLFRTQINKPLDTVLTIGTYVAVASTATTLLKGAYIQQFYGDIIYFREFGKLDIYSLLGVASLLLWYVLFHTSRMFKEALFISVKAEKATGI